MGMANTEPCWKEGWVAERTKRDVVGDWWVWQIQNRAGMKDGWLNVQKGMLGVTGGYGKYRTVLERRMGG